MNIIYAYYGGSPPPLLKYSLDTLRTFFDGEIKFITNRDMPALEYLETYGAKRLNELDYYPSIGFYNEYKILALRDFGDDKTVYLDHDILFHSQNAIDKMACNTNFFFSEYFSTLCFAATAILKTEIKKGYNAGVIKLDSSMREWYASESTKAFKTIKELKPQLPQLTIEAIPEEFLPTIKSEISPLFKKTTTDGSSEPEISHLMHSDSSTQEFFETIYERIYKNKKISINFNKPVLS